MHDVAPPERRRVPRVAIADTEFSVLSLPIPVRLLDISLGGVLLECGHHLELGTQGTLRFNFTGVPFSADVRVERIDRLPGPKTQPVNIAASFVALSPQDQRVIEQFAEQ